LESTLILSAVETVLDVYVSFILNSCLNCLVIGQTVNQRIYWKGKKCTLNNRVSQKRGVVICDVWEAFSAENLWRKSSARTSKTQFSSEKWRQDHSWT